MARVSPIGALQTPLARPVQMAHTKASVRTRDLLSRLLQNGTFGRAGGRRETVILSRRQICEWRRDAKANEIGGGGGGGPRERARV